MRALGQSDGLPVEAMLAARERRAEIAPLFIREIESFVDGGGDGFEPMALFFIFHLLGEWREKSAYRPLCRLLQMDPDILDATLGDATTATVHGVMEAVFDGNPEPLYEIILNAKADELIRSRMCEVLAMLALRGTLDRAEVARFLRDGFVTIQPQGENFVWDGWWCGTAMLGLDEHRILVKEVFDRRFVHPMWSNFEHFEDALKRWRDCTYVSDQLAHGEYAAFDDAIEVLSQWSGFSRMADQAPTTDDRFDDAVYDALRLAEDAGAFSEPFVNPNRDVGRNDPCPCGSGKKFKKCCLTGLSP